MKEDLSWITYLQTFSKKVAPWKLTERIFVNILLRNYKVVVFIRRDVQMDLFLYLFILFIFSTYWLSHF